tara:strand:- start:626 stop:1456 length:831 start_codon:yes stop_codon:yes gene_type:complete
MKPIIALLMLLIPLSSFAVQVDTSTRVTLVRPLLYDGGTCDVEVFSERLADLDLPNVPIMAANSVFDSSINNPAGNRGALVVSVNQAGMNTEVLRIEGLKTVTKYIQNQMAAGSDLRLTEYPKCVEADSSLQLVELVNLTPYPSSMNVDLNATLQVIRKNDQGVCDTMVSKTLVELIQGYNPGVDLSGVSYSINIFANGVTTEGQLHSKRIYITFRDKNGFPLSRPAISIAVPSALLYTALDKLSGPDKVLKMAGIRECLGDRLDEPVWILDLKIQ